MKNKGTSIDAPWLCERKIGKFLRKSGTERLRPIRFNIFI